MGKMAGRNRYPRPVNDMLTQKTLLPPEERILDVGWTDDGRLVLCFKYFEAPGQYDGYFPFSFFDPPLVTLEELDTEIVKHFGTELALPGRLVSIKRNRQARPGSDQSG